MKLKLIFLIVALAAQLVLAAGIVVPPVAHTTWRGAEKSCWSECYATSVKNLRMWGWSPAGLVAYSLDEYFRGDFIGVEFVIMNSKNGKILFSKDMQLENTPDISDWDSEAKAYVLDVFFDKILEASMSLYKQHGATISAALKKYDIRSNKSPLLTFPLQLDDASYNAILVEGEKGLHDRSLFIQKTDGMGKLSQKLLDKQTYEDNQYMTDRNIVGYFPSPFENRILIVEVAEHSPFDLYGIIYELCGTELK
jgi:hypothetical protein